MQIQEIRQTGPVCARIRVPGSKSLTNRALVCATLANGQSVLHNASDSNDTALMVNGLNQFGVLARSAGSMLIVEGTGGRLYAPKFPIPVGNAGTTLRFLLSLAALAQGTTVFDADPRMAERPVDDLISGLKQLGVHTEAFGARYTVQGSIPGGGRVAISGEKSSQFVSSLLMVAPYAQRDVTLSVSGKVSSHPYIVMTLDVMRKFGIDVRREGDASFVIPSGHPYVPAEYVVEGDASGASYFLAAAAITGGEVILNGIRPGSVQGDSGFVEILQKMGCGMRVMNDELRVKSGRELKGIDVDMNSMPDVVPTLAATALFAEEITRIRNVAHLRYKESDRLEALVTELQKVGADIRLADDGLEIRPALLHGAQLDTHDDHRLAMSFALIGLRVPGIKIENPKCVNKSFPNFWKEFEKLYA